jgi:hypothetical protein
VTAKGDAAGRLDTGDADHLGRAETELTRFLWTHRYLFFQRRSKDLLTMLLATHTLDHTIPEGRNARRA